MIIRQIETKQKKSLLILKIALGGTISEQMGLQNENGESWDNCEQKVKDNFMDKLELENNIIIERAHRAKKKANMARRMNLKQQCVNYQ